MLSVTRSSLIKTTITLCICVLILAACGGDEEGEAPRIETGGSRTDGSPCDPGPCILINIVDFSNHVMDDNPFYALNSDGVSKLTDYIDSLQFGGNTAAHEAAYEGTVNAVNVDLGSGDSVRRTVVLFTDGLENASDRPDYLDDLHVLQDDSPDLFTFVTGVKGEDVLLGNNDFLNTLCEYIEHMGSSCSHSHDTAYGKVHLLQNLSELRATFVNIASTIVTDSINTAVTVSIPINSAKFILWTLDVAPFENTPASSRLYILAEYDAQARNIIEARTNMGAGVEFERVSVDTNAREVVFRFDLGSISSPPESPRLWTRNMPYSSLELYSPGQSGWQPDTEPGGRTETSVTPEYHNAAVVLVIDTSGSLNSPTSINQVQTAIHTLLEELYTNFCHSPAVSC